MSFEFNSFFMGGFECSTHRDSSGRRLDLIDSTRHDRFAEEDYARMMNHGMATARDGVRWHLIEKEPYVYDFTSLTAQVRAASKTGIEVIWDLFHYGYPDDLDIFSSEFTERFAKFAAAVTDYLAQELGENVWVCPVNEISFFSWIAGHRGLFYPCAKRRGNELKARLIEAGIAAVAEIRKLAPQARFIFTDPAIHVVAKSNSPSSRRAAENYRLAQFEAFDVLAADASEPLQILGLNYYFHNQWRHPSRGKIHLGHEDYRPLNEILREYYDRYRKPIFIAETGIEDDERAEWFRYMCEQVMIARGAGLPVQGICLYPIVNHPGWADNRHCHNGLWDYANDSGERAIHRPLSDELSRQISKFR
jgi:beta-glucosidase/6-phospho-beta-glucosidase/beta-galactosidase